MLESEGTNKLYVTPSLLCCEPINRDKEVKEIKTLNNIGFPRSEELDRFTLLSLSAVDRLPSPPEAELTKIKLNYVVEPSRLCASYR